MQIKESKLRVMQKLEKAVGELTLAALIEGSAFLMRYSNEKIPYQFIIYNEGSPAYDSREKVTLSYACFEEEKEILPEERKGLQSFYKLRKSYIDDYLRHLKNFKKE